MKIEGKTIPATQNIKRREAYLLQHSDKLPKTYVQAQLLKIAIIRAEKKLRWDVPDTRLKTQEERMEQTKKMFTPIESPKGFMNRTKEWIDKKFIRGKQTNA